MVSSFDAAVTESSSNAFGLPGYWQHCGAAQINVPFSRVLASERKETALCVAALVCL